MEKELKEIVIGQNSEIVFPKGEENGDILIVGNFNGVCGEVKWRDVDNCSFEDNNFYKFQETFLNNIEVLMNTLRAGNKIFIVGSKDTIRYFKDLLYTIASTFMYDIPVKKRKAMFNKQVWSIDTTELYERTFVAYNSKSSFRKEAAKERIIDIVTNRIFEKIKHMKFDYIIQNPPYNKSLHLDFFDKGLDLLSDKGRMVIIEPATWLINIRKNGKAKKYDEIKKRIEGHVERVVIENLNKDFGTGLYVPFATTTIDMSKTFDSIELIVCGERRVVKSIYDCNLVGEYATIWSIIEKCQKFGDMMNEHITKEIVGDGMAYAKYAELLPKAGCFMTGAVNHAGTDLDKMFVNDTYYRYGFMTSFYDSGFHTIANEISENPLYSIQRGGAIGSHKLSDKIADNIYGTRQELENWKHFIFNNKLPLFLNIVLTIDQHNNSKDFLPWLVDKQYTDEEINQLFGFTDEEINLINRTIEKYERNSPWFKRYMCGPDSVSDEEVNNFMKTLNEKYA